VASGGLMISVLCIDLSVVQSKFLIIDVHALLPLVNQSINLYLPMYLVPFWFDDCHELC